MASCILILLYVRHEMSYNRFHPNAERTFRIGYEVSLGSGSKVIASSPYRLAPALITDFPELERVTHFRDNIPIRLNMKINSSVKAASLLPIRSSLMCSILNLSQVMHVPLSENPCKWWLANPSRKNILVKPRRSAKF